MDRRVDAYVYFLRRADGEGPIKIGCSQCPTSRLRNLMMWSPYPLSLLATTPGDERLERRFHTHFAADHSHNEWFNASLSLQVAVQAVADGSFDFSVLPEKGVRLHAMGRSVWTLEQRKRQSLVHRLAHQFRKTGIEAPHDLTAMVGRYEALSEDERVDCAKQVEVHLADPMRLGRLLEYPWCQKAYAAWQATLTLKAA